MANLAEARVNEQKRRVDDTGRKLDVADQQISRLREELAQANAAELEHARMRTFPSMSCTIGRLSRRAA